MTDKVEIKPDSTNETLEQSAEKLQKQGIDVSKDIITNSDASTEPTTEVKEEEVPKETKPEWLPEKFADAQELAKAYGELEKKQSQPKEETKESEEPGSEGFEKSG